MNERTFIVSREDWSLHRKGYQDQARHQQRINEVIQQDLPDLIMEENIIMSDGKQVIKVPIRSLDEFRFIYNFNNKKHVGQGDGDSQVGDVLGTDSSQEQNKGEEAKGQIGADVVEAEISIEDLENMLFNEMELPNLKKKEIEQIEIIDIRFNDIRKKGIMSNIDKKRTILENIRRNALNGKPGIHHINRDDLRYKTWNEVVKPNSSAVIIAMMDTSGSMGIFEKYCARSFFFWMTRFLRRQYEKVKLVFVAHHTEAREVSEEEFFARGESGGTICSSAYMKALEIIDERFPPPNYNIYPFHFSDGDNLTSDNERCVKLIAQLLQRTNMFGYGEVNQYNRNSTLLSVYRNIQLPNFMYYVIKEKEGIYRALKHFFKKQLGGN